MRNKRYSDEFKLQIVKEYLNSSLGCREITKKYNLSSKNLVYDWEQQLIKKGLLSNDECLKPKNKARSLNNSEKKTAYEKQLEKENRRLRAELAFYKELKNLTDKDNKKKSLF